MPGALGTESRWAPRPPARPSRELGEDVRRVTFGLRRDREGYFDRPACGRLGEASPHFVGDEKDRYEDVAVLSEGRMDACLPGWPSLKISTALAPAAWAFQALSWLEQTPR